VITTRSFIAQRRGTVIRFMRAFIRGMYHYKRDREFAKKALAKFAQLDYQKMVEATWQEYAAHLRKVPRPALKGIQSVIDSGIVGKSISKPTGSRISPSWTSWSRAGSSIPSTKAES